MGKKIPVDVLKYLVMEACKEGPTYGYEIVSRIENITDDCWSPSYGTIYPLTQRLADEGLIESLSDAEAEERGLETGERKYFDITAEGEERLAEVSREKRESFEDLIKGYLKVYEHVHGEEATDKFLENFKE